MLYSTYFSKLKLLGDFAKDKVIIDITRAYKSKDGSITKMIDLAPPAYLLSNYKKELITFEEFKFNYKQFMEEIGTKEALRKLHRLAKDKDVIIVCYEKDHLKCHRSIIGEFISSFNQVKYKEIDDEDIGNIDLRNIIKEPCMVKLNTDGIFMIVNDELIGLNSSTPVSKFKFSKNLVSKNGKYSIDSIYDIKSKGIKGLFSLDGLEKIWEREVFHEAI